MQREAKLKEKIFAELVRLLYVQAKSAIFGAILAGACIVFALYGIVSDFVLFNWFILVLIVTVLRYATHTAYFYANPPLEKTTFWYRLFLITSLLGAFNWALAGTLLLTPQSNYQIIIAFMIASIVAISIILFAASKLISTLFIFIVLIPFSVKMFLQDGYEHQLIGIFTSIYLGALLLACYKINNEVYAMFKLKIENNELIERLYAAKNEAETANSELQIEVSERKSVEILLRNSEEQYRLVTDALPVLIGYIDTQLYFRYANKAYAEWFQKPLSKIIGYSVKSIFGEASFSTFKENYQKMLAGENIAYETTMQFHDQERYVSVILIPHQRDQKILGAFSLISDMTPRINYLATHDSLTNLPNRSLFHARATHALKHAYRDKSQVALLFLDLDHFKNVNDTLGHDVGDQLLIQVVNRIKSCVRESDIVARLGGDEFIIMLEKISNIRQISLIAKSICDVLAKVFNLSDHDVYITTSVGISLYPSDGEDLQTLLKNADMAMYRAKEHGRNTYEFYTESMNRLIQKKLQMTTLLREALENNELKMQYQPLIDLNLDRISSFESLLCWQNPELGVVAPSEFIPVAEETDLIIPIGEWAIRTVCKQNLNLKNAGFDLQQMNVNVSVQQFFQINLMDEIKNILHSSKMPGKYLTLELAENAVIKDVDYSVKMIHELKELGITISLDDFGAGYSSLGYLKRLPVDAIKMARVFMTGFKHDRDAEIVKSIIAMAHNLNIRVVAMGVETIQQLDFLRAAGCDEVQGFLLCPPLEAKELTSILETPVTKFYQQLSSQ